MLIYNEVKLYSLILCSSSYNLLRCLLFGHKTRANRTVSYKTTCTLIMHLTTHQTTIW